MKNLLFAFILLLNFQLSAQSTDTLAIGDIMKGEDFVGSVPEDIHWSDNSRTIYFSWNPENDTLRSTYKVDPVTGDIKKLSVQQLKALPEEGEYSDDFEYKTYAKNGDIFLEDLKDFSITQVTQTESWESDPEFSGDQLAILYHMDNNIYAWDIEMGTVRQITNFSPGNEPEKKDKNSSALENDQMDLFKVLQKRKGEQDARQYRQKQISPDRPKKIYLGNKQISSLVISPDLHYVVYRTVKRAEDKSTIVPDYVTESGYTKEIPGRTKVGGPQDEYESWIVDIKRDTVYQIVSDELPGIYDKPLFLKEYEQDPESYDPHYQNPRKVMIGTPVFSGYGDALVNITSQDYKDRWIMKLDLKNGRLSLIDRQHDDAWIGGPGVGWFDRINLGWIDKETIWFSSEVTGYSHLYTANVRTDRKKALTSGSFEVLDVQLSRDKKMFYITSNKESPHVHDFYHLPVSGGKMEKITSIKGGYEVTVSPDEKSLAIRYSFSNKPWELYVMPNKAGAKMQQLTESTTPAFDSYDWRIPEIVNFTASDGTQVPASLYSPAKDKKNGAAVIFVHGAGYLQNVHYWWPSYFREYMFNNLLADQGYTVLAIDFRASAGYGRDWRTAIYRHMGGRDLEDQIDGADFLVKEYDIDPDRIGIYGGSYGGFITLMALFKSPGTFRSGAALRSVTDWAHYNHGYTANILNTPEEDSIAYKQSSPIYFAEGLEDNLLILHGMIDTNVHFQDVVRLSQRLIELGKKNWQMAFFPLESHGFVESSSWTDEYRRIYEFFQNTLLEEQ